MIAFRHSFDTDLKRSERLCRGPWGAGRHPREEDNRRPGCLAVKLGSAEGNRRVGLPPARLVVASAPGGVGMVALGRHPSPTRTRPILSRTSRREGRRARGSEAFDRLALALVLWEPARRCDSRDAPSRTSSRRARLTWRSRASRRRSRRPSSPCGPSSVRTTRP